MYLKTERKMIFRKIDKNGFINKEESDLKNSS
jgi:hypothetical protein